MFCSNNDIGVNARVASLSPAAVAVTSDAATCSSASRLNATPRGSPVVPEV